MQDDASQTGQDVVWDKVIEVLTPSMFADLQRRDAATVRNELAKSGLLDVVLSGKITESEWSSLDTLPKEEFRLFLASQVASQYIQRTLTAMRTRETGLMTALRDIERKIQETHSMFERVKSERERIGKEMNTVSAEIAECDRLLKASSPARQQQGLATSNEQGHEATEEDEEDDSPWEDHVHPRVDHHLRTSIVFGSHASSPMAKSSGMSSGFLHDANSPRQSRSRASSGGTSGGVTDDELVLFASMNTQNWVYDKARDTFFTKKPLEGITEGVSDNADDDVDEENSEFF